jgi:sulfide:quinone oxidoreductase
MPGKKIVIIGGGFGGAAAARAARALLGREHEVTLVDRSRRAYLCGSFPLLIVGEREADKVSRSLGSLARRGVRYLEAEVEGVDTASRTVATSAGKLEYDYLALAPGAVYDWEAVPGANTAYSFYNIETARRLRRKLASFRKGRVVIAVASVPYKCPPAPFETAMTLDWAFTRRGVRRDVEIHVFTPEPMPIPVAGPEAGKRLLGELEGRGVQVHTNAAIKEVAREGRQAAFSDGSALDAELVITVPVHRPSPLVRDAGLVGPSGWVDVKPDTLEASVPGVYAIGDVNNVPMANGRGIPKAGVFASAEGETVARNIAASINGTEPTAFPGVGYCFILYGGDRAGAVRGEFLASERPNVSLQPPTAEGYREKERFEEDWRRFRI